MLEVEFDKLREKLTELAEAATDSDPLETLAILTAMQQTLALSRVCGGGSSPVGAGRAAGAAGGGEDSDAFLAAMLQPLQQSLAGRFAKFVAEQEQWVAHQAPAVKRAGVLAPFAKFPVFVDRLALVRACLLLLLARHDTCMCM